MNKLQAAQDKFHSTRVEAIAAYKRYKQFEYPQKDYYMQKYAKAWQEHQEASMALFLLEAEQ